MKIGKNTVVTIDYTLKDAEGEIIDTSSGADPLVYLHGIGALIAGMESALDGKSKGDEFQIVITPEQGYGEYDEEDVMEIDLAAFEDPSQVQVGMELVLETEDEGEFAAVVTEVGEEVAIVDRNHPLAGMTLHFEVAVRDVRKATPEEIDHGHAH
ncbi:FKBP-type peptidyl-prolyl cis-trans isomerase [Blastopirellula marina]|uniref:Peptidyl-prolyl cis-trans isomerase n=1 Tax=Blastopirellula marina DSM 3645 TaxID=314230 RepID=A3ZYD0_9BACT|nr:peptidylprolyl isomerase [Blastopirellula marina]EAQ78372.1 peptidyl-prolyl cis-trans isomerase SlyD [Blastopirellula marina DSM 3645]